MESSGDGPIVYKTEEVDRVQYKVLSLLDEMIRHSGFSHMNVSVKILKGGKKEVIVACGKEYRFVLKSNEVNRDA